MKVGHTSGVRFLLTLPLQVQIGCYHFVCVYHQTENDDCHYVITHFHLGCTQNICVQSICRRRDYSLGCSSSNSHFPSIVKELLSPSSLVVQFGISFLGRHINGRASLDGEGERNLTCKVFDVIYNTQQLNREPRNSIRSWGTICMYTFEREMMAIHLHILMSLMIWESCYLCFRFPQ